MYQPEVDIYLNRLQENFSYLQRLVGSVKILAVVKANAYGHGLGVVAKTLSNSSVYGYCVAMPNEAEELIRFGIKKPILQCGRINKKQLELYSSGQVHCVIHSINDLDILKHYNIGRNYINAHLKIDTGMGRMGVRFDETENILNKIKLIPQIKIKAVFSHFSSSEEKDDSFQKIQLNRFQDIIEITKKVLPETEYFHLANSAGILKCPSSHFNMVRPGIALYGVSPLGFPHAHLRAVMRMKAPVVMIKQLKIGDSVGYNRLYTANENENIAIVQAGYADGIPLALSNVGSVEINGNQCLIAGKISMDLVAIKCGNNKVSVGDRAIFWGGNHQFTLLEELSKKYNKIPYEFLTGLSSRINYNLIYE